VSAAEPDAERDARPVGPPCRHLRHNGMYIFTDGSGESREDYDTSSYWCLHTMKSFGPDDERVGGEECRRPGRTCHEPL
jgi:hypothetical protein